MGIWLRPVPRFRPALVAVLLAAVFAATGCRTERAKVPETHDRRTLHPVPSTDGASSASTFPAQTELPATGNLAVTAEVGEPSLEAHLSRIPEGPGRQVVLRLELGDLATRQELRAAAGRALELLGFANSSNAACVAEIVGTVDAVTYVWHESVGPDVGLALVDAAVGFPTILACLQSTGLYAPPSTATAADDGLLALAPQISASETGTGTLAIGATELVRAVRDGNLSSPLSRSPALARARALASASPAWVALFHRGGAQPSAGPVYGALALRTKPHLAVRGTLVFADPMHASTFRTDVATFLDSFHRAGRQVLHQAERALSPEIVAPLGAVLDAMQRTTLTLEDSMLHFEALFPASLALSELLSALVALAPVVELL